MSSIESNNQSLNNILEKIGVKSPENAATKPKSSLGQEDFLKLMTTQLQNQDPFAPMENGEFIAQMAQFSTVTGITEMGQALKGISDKMSEFRIATASDLLGNSVLVPGNIVRPNDVMFREPLNPSLDGNTVELAVEQMEFSENVVRYQTTLQFLTNKISGLMSAIKGE